jgi:hypothetical protein
MIAATGWVDDTEATGWVDDTRYRIVPTRWVDDSSYMMDG